MLRGPQMLGRCLKFPIYGNPVFCPPLPFHNRYRKGARYSAAYGTIPASPTNPASHNQNFPGRRARADSIPPCLRHSSWRGYSPKVLSDTQEECLKDTLVASAARELTHCRPTWPHFCTLLVRISYLNVSNDLKNFTAIQSVFKIGSTRFRSTYWTSWALTPMRN